MRVSIVGTGYVGLVTGACLAEKGHDVTCVDVDPGRVVALNRAETPIFENGLEELLQNNVGIRLRATTDLAAAVMSSDLTLIAVGTPFDGKAIDLSAVLEAARQIGTVLKRQVHLSCRRSQEHRRSGDNGIARLASSGKRIRKKGGLGLRRRHEPRVSLRRRGGEGFYVPRSHCPGGH